MLLAFQLTDIVTVPFGWLLGFLYDLLGNYALSMIVFAVIVQLVLLPITMKSKKSMMKMSRLQPKMQEIQRKYADDKQKQNEALQQLQKEEGASMGCGGCLWSLVPMLILLPLYTVIRQPIVYILGQSAEVAEQIITLIKELEPTLFGSNSTHDQVVAAQAISRYATEIAAAIPGLGADTLAGINFEFLGGINLGAIPTFNVFAWDVWSWANIGAFLIPCLSAASQILQMAISQKTNNSVITDEKGVQDKETAANSQAAQQTKMMMWMMTLMNLWIGFSVPAALSLYWFVGGVVRTFEDQILTRHYRKIYDAEDAVRLQRAMELEAIEAEKERIRAEKRAANPDGITTNTSRKKLQQKQKEEQEAARAAAAREYAARKGAPEEEKQEKLPLSGISERPYCKGRAYDPDRYHSTEE